MYRDFGVNPVNLTKPAPTSSGCAASSATTRRTPPGSSTSAASATACPGRAIRSAPPARPGPARRGDRFATSRRSPEPRTRPEPYGTSRHCQVGAVNLTKAGRS